MRHPIKTTRQPLLSLELSPRLLIIGYLLLSATPLFIAVCQGWPFRSFPNELASSFGLIGFTWLLLSFLLSGRFRAISGQIGIDKTMRLHQLMAIALGLIVFLHPYLYTLAIDEPLPWDTTRQLSIALTGPAFISGMIAWVILPALIITSLFRDQLPGRYETWRALHGIGAVIIVVATAHHALEVGRYSNTLAMKIFWLSLIAVASLTLLRTYLLMPLLQKGRPFRILSVQPAADKMWHITLTSDSNNFNFRAGQFTWLKLNNSALNLTEHPFSISSSPSDLPKLRFTVKESGDFTNKISDFKEGHRAYIDGPHGNFIIKNQEFEGLVMIAGGIGVAPMISIINEMTQEKDPRPIKLLYGNRKEIQIAFKDELEAASQKLNLDIEYVLSEPSLDWEGSTGRLDSSTISSTLSMQHPENWLYLLCGPPSMLEPAIKLLKSVGIPNNRIIYEKFSYL